MALKCPTVTEKSESLSADFNFPCAPYLIQTHRKSSASLTDNGSFTPELLGPSFTAAQRRHQRTYV